MKKYFYAMFSILVLHSLWQFRFSKFVYQYFEDDFLYYLVIADHFLATGHLTFNGIVSTNGFHPLWFLLIVALRFLTGHSEWRFFFLFSLCIALLVLVAFFTMKRLLDQLGENRDYNAGLAFGYFLLAYILARKGMEISLLFCLVPVFYAALLDFYHRPAASRALVCGLLASLVVLSRLDSITFIFLPLGVVLLPVLQKPSGQKSHFITAKLLAAFLPGAGLLAAYFIGNKYFYGHFMPLSGIAKSLKAGFSFSLVPFSIFWRTWGYNFNWPLLISIIIFVALAQMLLMRKEKRGKHHALLLAFFASPIIYYLAIALRSDWIIWDWYFYPIVITFPLALYCLLENGLKKYFKPALVSNAIIAVCLVFMLLLLYSKHKQGLPDIVRGGQLIQTFAEKHPGIYAMGDRAGIVGYLLNQPVIQLEGIVGDRKMLENIKTQRSLNQVLREYQVDYYIANNPVYLNSAYLTFEPAIYIAGQRSPHMCGRFDEPPVYEFMLGGFHTTIFKLKK